MNDAVHRPGYQRRDEEIVDYHEYELDGTGLYFRGPPPPATGAATITFLGAAQTFGCLTDIPFPTLVGRQLGVDVNNLGYGGAGPRFFTEHETLLERANKSSAVVVQVMSARSEDNRLYRSDGLEYLRRRSDGAAVSAADAYRGLVEGYDPVSGRPAGRQARRFRSRLTRQRLAGLVSETRHNWVVSYERLFGALHVPTILLWFSTRHPTDLSGSRRTLAQLFGEYPQMVDNEMLAAIRPLASHYVSVVSDRGLPQPLLSRFDGSRTTIDPARDRPDLGGEVWTHNRYYPSPEMHRLAADELSEALRRMLT